jgi:radical SAM superfamily enzyme YgiQ (UPF0313 family)
VCSGVHWGGTSHATLVSRDLLTFLKRAAARHLLYGCESFSPRVLKTIGKGATVETNERARLRLDDGAPGSGRSRIR